jgi:phospholipase C
MRRGNEIKSTNLTAASLRNYDTARGGAGDRAPSATARNFNISAKKVSHPFIKFNQHVLSACSVPTTFARQGICKGNTVGVGERFATLAAGTIITSGLMTQCLADNNGTGKTLTPIKHLVIVFGENISFDHYFATYPVASNEELPLFYPKDDTPSVNGLTGSLLTNNPNLANPVRLSRADAFTCSFNHDYTSEQKAVNGGLLDKFVQATSRTGTGCATDGSTVMGYYDGNTVTALWNYAQHYAMNDNSFDTNFGPSTVGAINLISGQTGGGQLALTFAKGQVASFTPVTVTGDPDPALDDCGADAGGTATGKATIQMTSRNVGDLLNLKGITWGWFEGGFLATSPAVVNPDGSTATPAACAAAHIQHQYGTPPVLIVPNPQINPGADIHTSGIDYSPHHQPFQYYASTRNQHHIRPASVGEIGHNGPANHQYDISDFFAALQAHSLPAVSYVKAARYQDAHPSNSDPLLEQVFIVQVINALQQSQEWAQTAVFIQYDDADGWYDHVTGPILIASANKAGTDDADTNANDSLIPVLPLATSTAPGVPGNIVTSGVCGSPGSGALPARCGYGPRLPFVVISPWAKTNFVDHTLTDQTSSLRFIEENWGLESIDEFEKPAGQGSFDRLAGTVTNMFDFDDKPNLRPLILDPLTGQVVSGR